MKRILWCKRPTIKSKVVTGIVTFALLLSCFTGFLGGTVAHAASDAPPIAGGTPVDREYVAFRDISGESSGFRTTLWVQDVTQCKSDKGECSAEPGNSNSFEVAYCLHYNSQMPYDSREHKIQFDKETGLVQNAQKYWRYTPADRLIKNSVKNKTGQDANLRNIKKVLYHGYHDADDSQWQKDNKIQDVEFREGTQYALWHYTDNLDTSVSGWAWPNENVKKVYEYLVDKDNKLPDAPIDYEIKYFHTNEKPSNSHYTEYQDIVSVGSEAPGQPPIKPEPKKTKILFKKTDEGTGKPLDGVTIRVTAISKVDEDGTILFDKTLNLTNDDNAALELEADETYKIEETVVPDGYTKRNFEVSIDKAGNVTFKGDNADKGAVEYTSEAEGFKNAATMTLKNKNENATPIEIGTTVKLGNESSTKDKSLVKKLTESDMQNGFEITDTVSYKGLAEGNVYKLVAVLNKVEGDKVTPVRSFVSDPFVPDAEGRYDFRFSAQKGDIQLGDQSNSYVIYEYLFNNDIELKTQDGAAGGIADADKTNSIAKHENSKDKSQTFIVEKKTNKPVKAEIKVKKVLDGRDFQTGDEFEFTLEPGKNPSPKTTTVKVTDGTPVSFGEIEFTGAGTYEYTISEKAGNLPGVTYSKDKVTVTVNVTDPNGDGTLAAEVVYPAKKEAAEITNSYNPVEPTPAEQSLKTTVKAGESSGAEEKEATAQAGKVAVKDTVAYKGLEKGKEYVLKAELMEDGQKAIKTVYHVFTPQAADGEETVDFGTVELAAGKKYVVFESAIKTEDANKTGEGDKATYEAKDGKKWLEHKDASDKAQTVVVEKPVTPTPPAPNTPDKPGNPNPDKPHPEDPGKSKKHKSAPKTGDDFGMVYGYGAVMFISAAAVVIRLRRRNTV